MQYWRRLASEALSQSNKSFGPAVAEPSRSTLSVLTHETRRKQNRWKSIKLVLLSNEDCGETLKVGLYKNAVWPRRDFCLLLLAVAILCQQGETMWSISQEQTVTWVFSVYWICAKLITTTIRAPWPGMMVSHLSHKFGASRRRGIHVHSYVQHCAEPFWQTYWWDSTVLRHRTVTFLTKPFGETSSLLLQFQSIELNFFLLVSVGTKRENKVAGCTYRLCRQPITPSILQSSVDAVLASSCLRGTLPVEHIFLSGGGWTKGIYHFCCGTFWSKCVHRLCVHLNNMEKYQEHTSCIA